jgi:hypothetical protein
MRASSSAPARPGGMLMDSPKRVIVAAVIRSAAVVVWDVMGMACLYKKVNLIK